MMDNDKETLWFTSSTSVSMMDHATLSGLYKCSFDRESGECDSPELIADKWLRNGKYHHGNMELMNVQIEKSEMMIYSRVFDSQRNSWEIIRAPLHAAPRFESYFRTSSVFEWNECNFNCCGDEGHTYVQVTPKSFFVEGDDVFGKASYSHFIKLKVILLEFSLLNPVCEQQSAGMDFTRIALMFLLLNTLRCGQSEFRR